MRVNQRRLFVGLLLLSGLMLLPATQSFAWVRGPAPIFAVLPQGSPGPEGLTVGPDGNVYVATFGFFATSASNAPGQLFTFASDGRLIRQVSVANSSPNLLGIAFHPVTHDLLVLDCAANAPSITPKVLAVDPKTGASKVFMTVSSINGGRPCPNGVAFDQANNVYVSDSFQGVIWKTGPAGGTATAWASDPVLLKPAPTVGVPPFGANGIAFNREGTALFVANTGNDSVLQIPLNADGTAGKVTPFAYSINGADGLVIDADDNVWVAANQEDEIVVLDHTGKVIAKRGDFRGLSEDGLPRGLLFPASLAFSNNGHFLYVTNLALNMNIFGLPTIDSPWEAQVKRYTVSRLPAILPPLSQDVQ